MDEIMNREKELEVVTTAYFLVERISELERDKQQLQGSKPNKPKIPVEPQLETQTIKAEPYPDIQPGSIEFESKWKKIMVAAVFGPCILGSILSLIPIIRYFAWLVAIVGEVSGIIYGFKTKKSETEEKKRLEQESIERIRNSSEYIQKCKEIDEQNRLRQAQKDEELQKRYLQRYEEYKKSVYQYELDLKQYEEQELPEWNKDSMELSTVLENTKDALEAVYNKNIIPIQFRRIESLVYLATFLSTSQYDLRFAIENYNSYVAQRKQDQQISLQVAQLQIMKETLKNQQYSNWLLEQILDISEKSNNTLKSISNWQKADVSYRVYKEHKREKARKKARKAGR